MMLMCGVIQQERERTEQRWMEAMDVEAILDAKKVERMPDEGERTAPHPLSEEEYRRGYIIGKVLLLLDDLQRKRSLDSRSLQELTTEVALWL